jgi:hypothetical protein
VELYAQAKAVLGFNFPTKSLRSLFSDNRQKSVS